MLTANSTLTILYLYGPKRKEDISRLIKNHFLSTANNIGSEGAAKISESLKTNTSLTEIYLRVEGEYFLKGNNDMCE